MRQQIGASEIVTLESVISKCKQRSEALRSFTVELTEEWDYEPANYHCKHLYSICGKSYVHVRDVGVQQVISLKVPGRRWVSIIKNKKGVVVTENLPPYDHTTQFRSKPRGEMPQATGGYKEQSVGDLIRNPAYFPLTRPIYQRRKVVFRKSGAEVHAYWSGQFKTRKKIETLSFRYSTLDPNMIVEAKVCCRQKDDDSLVFAETWIVEETMVAEHGSLVPKSVKQSYDSRGQNPPDTTWKLTFDTIRIGEIDDAAFEIDTYIAGTHNVTCSDWEEFEAANNNAMNRSRGAERH